MENMVNVTPLGTGTCIGRMLTNGLCFEWCTVIVDMRMRPLGCLHTRCDVILPLGQWMGLHGTGGDQGAR